MPELAQSRLYADLAVLVAIARAGSLTRAAKALQIPPTTLGRRLAALEQALNTPLVLRTTRRLTLTEDALLLVERVGGAVDELQAALNETAARDGRLRGTLRVTAPVLAGREVIGPLALGFARRHPELRIDLVLSNTVLDMVEGNIDLAFRLGPVEEGSGVVRTLWEVPYGLFASPGFQNGLDDRLAGGAVDLLAEVPCVVVTPMETWRFRNDDGAVQVVRPQASWRVNDLGLTREAAAAGLGVTLLPRLATQGIAGDGLDEMEIAGWRPLARSLVAVFPAGRQRSGKARALVDHILSERGLLRPASWHPPSPR